MEVRKGYRQNEIRVIPDDWVLINIGSIADPNKQWSFTGGPFGSNLKASDYTDDGIRVIQLQNIGDGYFKTNYEVFTSANKADELLSCNIYPGEIILSKMGDPVARACIIPSTYERYLMCSDGIRLSVDQKRFNTFFVCSVINAQDFRTKAENAGTGSTRQRIGLTELRNLELICPPTLAEQESIAEVLTDADALIEAVEQLLAKKRHIKQGAMQELLTGKRHLPEFSGKWETKKLGEIGIFSKGKGLPKKDLSSDGKLHAVPYTAMYTDFTEIIKIDLIKNYTSSTDTVLINSPHILIAGSSNMLENVGKVGAFNSHEQIAVGGDIILYRTSADVRYISYLLNTPLHRKRIVFLSQGSTIRHVYISTFFNYEIEIPKLEEQQAIAEILSDMDAEIATLEDKLTKARQIKQGMMQELLTGRIRLL
jgi:type I restriction enzyme S subunit